MANDRNDVDEQLKGTVSLAPNNTFATWASFCSFYRWRELRSLGSLLVELDFVLMVLEYKSMFFLILRYYFSLWL